MDVTLNIISRCFSKYRISRICPDNHSESSRLRPSWCTRLMSYHNKGVTSLIAQFAMFLLVFKPGLETKDKLSLIMVWVAMPWLCLRGQDAPRRRGTRRHRLVSLNLLQTYSVYFHLHQCCETVYHLGGICSKSSSIRIKFHAKLWELLQICLCFDVCCLFS